MPPTSSQTVTVADNDTAEILQWDINEKCNDPLYLCSHRDKCVESTHFTNRSNIDKICKDHEDANICLNDIKECVVQVKNNTFDSAFVSTSFVNIILPIKNEFDKNGNQKFLRLPPLSSSKSTSSKDICNICSCVSRFATSGTSPRTSPGSNICEYNDKKIETVYYPVVIENMNKKADPNVPMKVGNYNVLSSNIIYATSEEELEVCNLYNLLIKNDVLEYNAVQFIKNIYQTDPLVSKKIESCIQQNTHKNKGKNGAFYQNISFFYITFAIFLVLFFVVLI
jgi:hypothetical protein